jgi:hypothetical protein
LGAAGENIPSLFTAKAAKNAVKTPAMKAKHIMSPKAREKMAKVQ